MAILGNSILFKILRRKNVSSNVSLYKFLLIPYWVDNDDPPVAETHVLNSFKSCDVWKLPLRS